MYSVASVLVIFLISLHTTLAGYDNEVSPECKATDKICHFRFLVTRQETMMLYDYERVAGTPIVWKNETLFKRINAGCADVEPATEEDLNEVNTGDGKYKHIYTINGQFPGPTVTVYEGQQVVIKVTNKLLQEGVGIHWHGILQRNTPWMDGVPGVSHCAILPDETFTYRFIAEPVGTHWYHSHIGVQRTDGMFGALIVLPKPEEKEEEPHTIEVAQPEHKDYVMIIHDWYHMDSNLLFVSYFYELTRFMWDGYDNLDTCWVRTQQSDGAEVGTVPFYSGLINGKGHYYKNNGPVAEVDVPLEVYQVTQGKQHRIRMINTGMNYAFRISVDKHKLKVVSSDGNKMVPVMASSVIVHSGERYDIIVEADQPVDNYWIRAETLNALRGNPPDWQHPHGQSMPHRVMAVLRYDGADPVYPTSRPEPCTATEPCVVINCPFKDFPASENATCMNIDDMVSIHESETSQVTDKFEEHLLNFHFPGGFGGSLRSAVNGIQFVPPSSPPQVLGHVNYDEDCSHYECDKGPCRCTHQLKLTKDNLVQLTLISTVTPLPWEGLPVTTHPVHLHGHHFEVLKIGYPLYNETTKIYKARNPDIDCPSDRCHQPRWSDPSFQGGNVPGLNLKNPPRKDTIQVPAGGYVILRFKADNIGWWMMHCHVEIHHVEGMGLIVQIGDESDMNPPPKGFATCGTFDWSADEFEEKLKGKHGGEGKDKDSMFKNIGIPVISAIVIILVVTAVGATLYCCSKRKSKGSKPVSSVKYGSAVRSDTKV